MRIPLARIADRAPERSDEAGSITPFVVIIALAIVLLSALVVDGGRQLNGKGRAVSYAQEAARAGAQAVDVADPDLKLNGGEAKRAAQEYCERARAADAQLVSCSANMTTVDDDDETADAIEVTTTVQLDAILLGMIGRHELESSGTAVARPVAGISEAGSGQLPDRDPPSIEPPDEDDTPETAPSAPPEEDVTPCDPDADDDNDSDDDGDDDDGGDDDGDNDSDDGDDDDGDDDDGGDDDGNDDSDLEPCKDLDD